jgi:glucose-1-phosphate thymidylyltransferase
MKGIILAGGAGTRLHPVTKCISKQLLPVYDKPMIYYPLSVLLLAGIKDILIISTPTDIKRFEDLFGDGSEIGVNMSYKVQEQPNGIAQAFVLGDEFIADDSVALILGDNIFYGHGLSQILQDANNKNDGATVFAYYVRDPQRFGVVDFDQSGKALSIEEKPKNPKSQYAVTGLYFYDNSVVKIAKSLKSSSRGEYEITDLNNTYLEQGKLNVVKFGRGFAWLDTGTHDSLIQASQFIKTVEENQDLKIACIEEIAYNQGFISKNQLKTLAENYGKSTYGEYLNKIVSE